MSLNSITEEEDEYLGDGKMSKKNSDAKDNISSQISNEPNKK